jgi:hypothetical protein
MAPNKVDRHSPACQSCGVKLPLANNRRIRGKFVVHVEDFAASRAKAAREMEEFRRARAMSGGDMSTGGLNLSTDFAAHQKGHKPSDLFSPDAVADVNAADAQGLLMTPVRGGKSL